MKAPFEVDHVLSVWPATPTRIKIFAYPHTHEWFLDVVKSASLRQHSNEKIVILKIGVVLIIPRPQDCALPEPYRRRMTARIAQFGELTYFRVFFRKLYKAYGLTR